MKINIKPHLIEPDLKTIEIIDERLGLIATIVPKSAEIVIVSKYIHDVEKDMAFPPKIIIKLR